MKFKAIATALVLSATAPMLFASPHGDAEVFKQTVKHVDVGGSFLSYSNTQDVQKAIPELIKLAGMLAGELNVMPAEDASEIARIVFDALNLHAIQGCASSVNHPTPDVTVLKSFYYLGNNVSQPGIYDICGRNNFPADFERLPADTRFVFATNIEIGTLGRRLEKSLVTSRSEKIRQLPQVIRQQTGLDVFALLDNVSGLFCISVQGDRLDNLQVAVIFPDKNGGLNTLAKTMLPQPDAKGRIMLPVPAIPEMPQVKPYVVFKDNRVILLSSDPVRREARKRSELQRYLPANGNMVFMLDLDQATINYIISEIRNKRKIVPFARLLKPFTIMGVGTFGDTGFGSTVAINADSTDFLLQLPFDILDVIYYVKKGGRR